MFTNYSEILGSGSFWRQVCNSTLIALVSTLLTVPLAALAAFVFARFAFPGREALYAVFTLGLLFPVAVAILPIFIMVREPRAARQPARRRAPAGRVRAAADDRHPAPVLPSFPNELQDAAAIDGCGPFRFFWQILLPLSRPVLATVSVLAIVGSWNAFLLPLVVLTDADNWTLPLGVTNYSTAVHGRPARILAFTTLSMFPALVFYAFAERHLVAWPHERRGQGLNCSATVPAVSTERDQSFASIPAALAANMTIAIAKGVAAALTGSPALFAETLHTVADAGNEVLLFVALRRASRPPDAVAPAGLRPRALLLGAPGRGRHVRDRRGAVDLGGHPRADPPARAGGVLGRRHRARDRAGARLGQPRRRIPRAPPTGEQRGVTVRELLRESPDPTVTTVYLEDTIDVARRRRSRSWRSSCTRSPARPSPTRSRRS